LLEAEKGKWIWGFLGFDKNVLKVISDDGCTTLNMVKKNH
jgi:hypothetical protein